jgi:hypothetical protein
MSKTAEKGRRKTAGMQRWCRNAPSSRRTSLQAIPSTTPAAASPPVSSWSSTLQNSRSSMPLLGYLRRACVFAGMCFAFIIARRAEITSDGRVQASCI